MTDDRRSNHSDPVSRLRTQGVERRDRAQGRSARAAANAQAESEKAFVSRRKFVLGAMGLGALAGVGKLAQYQLVGDTRAQNELYWRRMYNQTLYARRGTIYDRNGNILTSSEDCYRVAVNPTQVESVDDVVSALTTVLGLDRSTCRAAARSDSYTYVAHKVDEEDGEKLEKRAVPGIVLEPAMKRVYPFGSLASQVLGVTDLYEHTGKSGLELEYEDVLAGTNGSLVREHAADGTYIAGGAYEKTPAQDGLDLVLTIDINIQQEAEEALAQALEDSGADYGSIVVTDPRTGEILAACSAPTFNPDDLSSARTEDMNLRVVTDAYEPGSVFKALVCGMSIDLGIATPDTTFEVPAVVKAGDDEVYDVDKRDYAMTMTMREIMRRSSNTGMVLVGSQVGADNFAKYIKKYRIGKKSGVDFPGESTGIVKKRDEYDGASVAAMSFGQSLSVSPVEIVRAMSAIANKGIMTTPHFLKSCKGEEKDWTDGERRAVSEETAEQVADMMKTVVDEGTGKTGQVPGYDVSGKTGTAQRASSDGGYQENSYMASFMGFAPTKDPQVMVYVTLDGTSRSSLAAATPFATVMERALSTLGIQPTS